MSLKDKPLVWLHGGVKTPPLSSPARIETGYLLRVLQGGGILAMPFSRSMPTVGKGCHELRITDENRIWRIIYRIDSDAIVIADVFEKKTSKTRKATLERSKKRLRKYDNESG